MLSVFPRRKTRLEVRRDGMGMQRKTDSVRTVRSTAYARFAGRAPSSSRANSREGRRHIAGLLLSPVMIFPSLWFGWRFRKITGEIFFVHSPRAGSGATTAKSSGLKSPVPKHQVSDSIESFALQNFSRNMQRAGTEAARPGASTAILRTTGTARKSAGRKSPVPKHQVSDSIESFALQNFSRNMPSAGTEAACRKRISTQVASARSRATPWTHDAAGPRRTAGGNCRSDFLAARRCVV